MQIKKETKRINNNKIIILLPYWSSYGTKKNSFDKIKENIPKEFGYISYFFTKDIINSNPLLTKKYFNRFLSQVIKDINKVKTRKFYIYAQSLGGLFAMIISDKCDIKKCILINPGNNLAESFWNGTATTELKKEMENKGITLKKLKKIWNTISPDFYFKNKSKNTEFYIKLSKIDKIIPYKNGKKLIKLLKQNKINFKLHQNFLSHSFSLIYESIFPKTTLNFIIKEK
jgi:predicted esterase YcpF (UPF0227 family)